MYEGVLKIEIEIIYDCMKVEKSWLLRWENLFEIFCRFFVFGYIFREEAYRLYVVGGYLDWIFNVLFFGVLGKF